PPMGRSFLFGMLRNRSPDREVHPPDRHAKTDEGSLELALLTQRAFLERARVGLPHGVRAHLVKQRVSLLERRIFGERSVRGAIGREPLGHAALVVGRKV